VLSLQRNVGNRAVTRLLARAPVTWSGSVFLPGAENVGHKFTLEGTSIVEGAGRTKRTVGTIAAEGMYTLVDENGAAVPGATGSVGDLVGQVTRKGGSDPGVVTSTTGTGEFAVWDDAGTEHDLKVRDGGVYSTVGKRQELVGDIDVSGRYHVKLDGHVLTGSLTDPKSGLSDTHDVSLKRGDAKHVVDQLQIGEEPIPAGFLVFPEGKYTVKDGRLYQPGSQRAVGTIKVVKSGAALDRISVPVSYEEHIEFADGAGFVQHQTDVWRSVPAAGSVLRVGKGRSWLISRGSYWEEMSGAPVGRGYELFGGGKLTPTLRGLRALGKIEVTDDEIDLMQGIAEVESGGFTQCVNTWDSDVVSLGFMQYTLAGELQELIDSAPAAFARYGIGLGPNMPLRRSGGTESVKGIQGVTDLQELRSLEWAGKFFRAGLDWEIIAAEVDKAKADFAAITTHDLGGVGGIPELNTPRVKAIIFELHNNRPVYVPAVVAAAAKEIKNHPGATLAQVVGFLRVAMEKEYVDNNKNGINGATDADARKKADDIVTRTGAAFPNPY
jgi:hypothetical protein